MNDPDVIAWFDPGLTTGGAVYDITADRFMSGQYDYVTLTRRLDRLRTAYAERLAIGWELYVQTSRPRPGSRPKYAHDAIAIIEHACNAHGIPMIKGQPSSARTFKSTVVFLRRLGWYRPGMNHANDAACHLFRHLIRMKPIPENIRRGLPPGY